MNATHATTGLAAVLIIGLFGIVQSAQAHQCTLADAAGRFGYTSNGSIVTTSVPALRSCFQTPTMRPSTSREAAPS